MPKLVARLATSIPILPRPIIPKIFPYNSTPMNFFLCHSPLFIDASAWDMFLERESISDIVCSAVDIVFPPGVFMTIMPRLEAAARSTLSRPTPALPITFNLSAASMTSFVTLVLLRTKRTW